MSAADTAREGMPLSPREFDLAKLVADGLSSKDIGARLSIEEGTVKTHIRSAYVKLGLKGMRPRVMLAVWCVRQEQRAA